MTKFWELPIEQLDRGQWEALCDGCGKCCIHKLEDEETGEVYPTNVACRLLDRRTGFYAFDGISYMGEYTGLSRNLVFADHFVHQLHQLNRLCDVIGGGVNSNHGIAITV